LEKSRRTLAVNATERIAASNSVADEDKEIEEAASESTTPKKPSGPPEPDQASIFGEQ
jgi:hypothetical protein